MGRSAAPIWISRTGNASSSTGSTCNGVNAKAANAPADKAIRSARRPRASASQRGMDMRRRSVRSVANPPFVMAVIGFGHQVRFDHHGDVGGVELRVDHRAIADEPAKAQIALEQWR